MSETQYIQLFYYFETMFWNYWSDFGRQLAASNAEHHGIP